MSDEMYGQPKEERSLGELLGELSRETTTLVREEMHLAKLEMSEKAKEAGKDIGFLAAGGAVFYAGFLVLLAAIVVALWNAGMPLWGSALLIGAIVAGVGGFLVWKGIDHLKNADFAPREAIEALKGDRNESASVRRRAIG
ncbi:MAG: hypothetical protein K0Q72_2429 [Armatimonadetes bacterium]|jgi:hypothetical protein|nr:hypothetical protein [Armatimonadota bacterium]